MDVPWPHLLLLYTWLWNASSRLWRMVLKGDQSWEWGTSLFLRVFIGKEQSLLAARHGDNSIQLYPPTIYWVIVSILSKASKNPPKLFRECPLPPLASLYPFPLRLVCVWYWGTSIGLELSESGLKISSLFCHLQALWLWASHLISLSLNFPTFKIGIIMPASWSCFWVELLD